MFSGLEMVTETPVRRGRRRLMLASLGAYVLLAVALPVSLNVYDGAITLGLNLAHADDGGGNDGGGNDGGGDGGKDVAAETMALTTATRRANDDGTGSSDDANGLSDTSDDEHTGSDAGGNTLNHDTRGRPGRGNRWRFRRGFGVEWFRPVARSDLIIPGVAGGPGWGRRHRSHCWGERDHLRSMIPICFQDRRSWLCRRTLLIGCAVVLLEIAAISMMAQGRFALTISAHAEDGGEGGGGHEGGGEGSGRDDHGGSQSGDGNDMNGSGEGKSGTQSGEDGHNDIDIDGEDRSVAGTEPRNISSLPE